MFSGRCSETRSGSISVTRLSFQTSTGCRFAIKRTVEAIARHEGNNRNLLVTATGTGKTYTAFQIIYRLWKSGQKKRFLFPADRTSLIDQPVPGDFRHFKDAMTVIKRKQIDTAYNIYLALYQGLAYHRRRLDRDGARWYCSKRTRGASTSSSIASREILNLPADGRGNGRDCCGSASCWVSAT